jgi:hypothetical protein
MLDEGTGIIFARIPSILNAERLQGIFRRLTDE